MSQLYLNKNQNDLFISTSEVFVYGFFFPCACECKDNIPLISFTWNVSKETKENSMNNYFRLYLLTLINT